MPIGLIGIKCGMTRCFTEAGHSIPVSVIRVAPHYISQIKTEDKEGYAAIQITTIPKKTSRLTKPQAGHFRKAGVEAGYVVREFLLSPKTKSQLTSQPP